MADGADDHRVFWADAVADAVEARDPTDPIVVKGGVSPSGVPHIGHLNEIVRGYYVAEVLRERGHEVRQVFTADDRDRLRAIPRTLATLEWEVVDLGDDRVDAGALGRNLGRPYTDVPDPFGCCDSYGAHFTRLLARSAELLGVPIEMRSTTAMYEAGAFEDVTRELLADREGARDLLADFQDGVDASAVPFAPQCASCGRLTDRVTAVDLEAGTVEYVCADVEAGGQTIEGCGHQGTATLREGKLPWRFEWPAQWRVLGVDFEPFGKDHAEGSWPSGEAIARELLGGEPPVPLVYEWFTLDGAALSSSSGNVVTAAEVLELVEPEVLRYFYALDPGKQRDFAIATLDQLVDDFDRFERRYYGETTADDQPEAFAARAYPFVVDASRKATVVADEPSATVAGVLAARDVDPDPDPSAARRTFLDRVYVDRVRIAYRFAAVLGMTDDRTLQEAMAGRSGHLPAAAPEWAIAEALERIDHARAWAVRVDNEYNYRLAETLPDVSVDPAIAAALDDLADAVAAGADDLQGEIYETARAHDVEVGALFRAGYRLFLDEDEGPRLGPFLAALDETFVVRRLRREA